jgi:hypothetical protein
MTRQFYAAVTILALLAGATPVQAVTVQLTSAFADTAAGGLTSSDHHSGLPPQISSYQSTVFKPLGGAMASSGAFGVSATSFGLAAGAATELYEFRVDGPQNGILVPLSVASTLAAIAEEAGCANMNCQHTSASSNISYDGKLVAQRSSNPNELIDFPPAESVLSGDVHQVNLFAEASALDSGGKLGAFAQADSSLTLAIDPLWLAANPGYSLEFSDGVDPAVTPLPSALPMFGAALLGLIAFAWRGRALGA